jgi:hypothetical protein
MVAVEKKLVIVLDLFIHIIKPELEVLVIHGQEGRIQLQA